jgi:hypothetical protein
MRTSKDFIPPSPSLYGNGVVGAGREVLKYIYGQVDWSNGMLIALSIFFANIYSTHLQQLSATNMAEKIDA